MTLILLIPLIIAVPASDEDAPVALTGGTVLTITRGTLEGGTVVLEKGKIAAVGKDVPIPEGAILVDTTGKYVMPGIVETHSHLGVYSWPGVRANADGNEATDPITPDVRAEDSVNIRDPAFERARAGGVTTIQILPGSANLIGGQTVTIKLRPDETLEGMIFQGAPRGMKMAIGENPRGVYGPRGRSPATRMGNAFILRQAFVRAQEYALKWEKHEAGEGEPPDRDLKMDALRGILDGKIRPHIHCYRADGILQLIQISQEFDFQIASFQHALEAYMVADEIAEANIGIATFADWWGYKVEAWNGIPQNAGICARKGVRVSMHSDSADLIQRLYHEAAKAVKHGLDPEEGLKSITIHPAWMLGIDDRVGSIEVGKDADIAVFSRHPYDIYARVDRTYIDGRLVYER
jgi:imidazolonepropionase-like amidohydrolase